MSANIEPGEVVGGKYRIESILGRGGLGVVYRAEQLDLGRTVALKMMLPHALASEDGRARFLRETELAKRLEHPNTVRLYDFGEAGDGAPFIVWEYLKGRGLDEILRTEGALTPSRVVSLGAQTLRSLMEAHALGIVHRDIKPSNLFVCDFSGARDFVKVLDFGIAKIVGGSGVTKEDMAIGTPAYMAPEQVRGAELSPACDIYSLGLVLAEAISGEAVFGNRSGLEVAMAQLSDAAPPLSDAVLASPLGPLITRATRKDASLRFQSASDMLAALEAVFPSPDSIASSRGRVAPRSYSVPITSGSTVVPGGAAIGPTEAFAPSTSSPSRQPRRLLIVGASLGIVSMAGIVFGLWALLRTPRTPSYPGRTAPTSSSQTLRAVGPPLRIATMNLKQLRDRLERMGFKLSHETRLDDAGCKGGYLSFTTLNVVGFLDFASETVAAASEPGFRRSDWHFRREGTRYVMVTGPDADRLLDQLAH